MTILKCGLGIVITAALLSIPVSFAAQTSPDLAGEWVYSGQEGRAVIKQTANRVTLELTYTPNTAPSPHYKIDTTMAGQTLNGAWQCVTPVCAGQSGKFHAELSADASRLTVSQTDDPGGRNGWNGTVLVRAPADAADMARAIGNGGSVEIYNILFDTDQAVVKPESKPTLDEIAKLLRNNSSLKLEVAGHTDNTGTAQHNLLLSQERAQAVVQALVKNYAITAARLQAKGYGDTKPLAPNDTERNRANNRRVELRKI